MPDFLFRGEIPASKSLLNRALLVADYFPQLQLLGDSKCDDVRHMKAGLLELHQNQTVNCGEGGTTFRFLALRASRMPGRHILTGTQRLLSRPQKTLLHILKQLGVFAELTSKGLVIESEGWRAPSQPLLLSLQESSQFASGVFLNSWDLEFDLCFQFTDDSHSRSYLDLTLNMLRELGMNIQNEVLLKGQKIAKHSYRVESDLSSAFSMAAVGALIGSVELKSFPFMSEQPDRIFLNILSKMGVLWNQHMGSLVVKKSVELKPIKQDLGQSPDLFPVLAVLCSYAEGESRLYGAPQLIAKESNRIAKTAELLRLMGIENQEMADGIIIFGKTQQQPKTFTYDPDQDHRMAMAAGIAQLCGHAVQILHPESLNKSFPEFFKWTGVST